MDVLRLLDDGGIDVCCWAAGVLFVFLWLDSPVFCICLLFDVVFVFCCFCLMAVVCSL